MAEVCDLWQSSGTYLVTDLDATVEDLAPRLLRYCYGCSDNAALAEEAAQDALAALVQAWRKHGRPASPAGFAFTVARRRLRRAVLRARLLAPLEALRGHIAAPTDLEIELGGRQELARVATAVRSLPKHERDALLLATAGDLPLAEVAALTGTSLGAVKMRIYRARRRLAAALGR